MTLDIRTVFTTYLISAAICTGVMAFLWWRNRQQWAGQGGWLAGFGAHLAALTLVLLRDTAPDFLSIILAGLLFVASPLLIYEGLSRFTQRRVAQIHNLVLLLAFVAVHVAFTFVRPDLAARELNLSVVSFVFCAQCAWLTLQKAPPSLPSTRWLSTVWIGYCLTSLARIALVLTHPPNDASFFKSTNADAWIFVSYQMLFILLTFGLGALVNRRLALYLQLQSEALNLSQDKFAKIFHASPNAVLITRARDGMVIEVNGSFSQLSGYARDEVVGHTVPALNLFADPRQNAAYVAALQSQPPVRDRECDFIGKHGVRLTCLLSGELLELQGQMHILSIVRDVTEARKAEAALRENEARLRAIGDNLPAGQIYQLQIAPDGTHRFTYISGTVEQLHGITAADAMADPSLLFDRIIEEDRDDYQRAVETSLRDMSIYDHEVRVRQKSGEIRWHRHISKPRQGEDGSVLFDGLDMDITEHKRAQEERERLIEELDAFAHTVAHDLKSPLTAVISYAELLRDEAPTLAPTEQQYLRNVIWMSRKMANIIDELLLMAGMRQATVNVRPLDMSRIVNESLQRLAFLSEEY